MTDFKWTMTRAAALRCADRLLAVSQNRFGVCYGDVLRALNEENFNREEAAVRELLKELRVAATEGRLYAEKAALAHALIADACAYEARESRETLSDMRRAFSKLGVIFADDLKPESLKE